MAFIQRFSTIDRGGIRFIGNTLGLSKLANANSAGTLGSIGAFTTLANTQVSNFPVGTTLNYLENGSSANLILPIGSSVLYAELVWGGLYKSQTQDISAVIDNAVTLNINNQNFSITPDEITKQTFSIPSAGFDVGFYVRTANVTNIVSSIINGIYTVSSVPALAVPIDGQTSETNHAGWTLVVAYRNANENLRNLTVWTGGAVVGPNTPLTDVSLTGFNTPTVLPISGKAFISAQEGDAVISGDQFLFGKDAGSLSVMSGPNNPANNFFCSQINDENGLLDSSGTFGARNANALAGTNTVACRQGWDITSVDVSNKLEPSQTSALLRFTSTGDLYVPNALAIQVDSLGASLLVTKSVDKDVKIVGEEILYTINVENTGQLDATNVQISDVLPAGLTLVSGSITIDGVPQVDSFPINISNIASGATVVVTYKLVANAVPIINPAVNVAKVNFSFEPFAGFTVNIETFSNLVNVTILNENMNVIKTVDKLIAKTGDTLVYTSFIVNNGTLVAQNIVFTDPAPAGTTFIPDSVFIDNVQSPGADPAVGVNIGTLNPTEFKSIAYSVTIN